MARTLNFNDLRPPVMPVILSDDAQTRLNVVAPTLDLIEELRANLPKLQEVFKEESEENRAALYDLAAKLLSCNRNARHFTGADLRDVYRMDIEDLVLFFSDYSDFLSEIKNAKN